MSRRDLRGRRIIVTGASSGIGRALAMQLVQAGACVLATARRADRLNTLQQELQPTLARHGGELQLCSGDICDAGVRQQLVDQAISQWSGLDGLVNNAGSGAVGRFSEADPQRLQKIFAVNLFAPIELTRLALPSLAGGVLPFVANVGSILGHVAMPLKSEYCASKFALRGWSDALASELVSRGIDVLWVAPNTTRSEFFDNLIEAQGSPPRNPFSMSPEAVASRIVHALQHRRSRLILTAASHGLLAADFFFPRLLRWILGRGA